MQNTIDIYLSGEEVITPEEFLRRRENGDPSVKGAEFIPPSLGSRNFGLFKIKHASPTYAAYAARNDESIWTF